jgi:hypothetical protein
VKRSQPPNPFELEGLEQRILLSGDSLSAGIRAIAPDDLDAFDQPFQLEEIQTTSEDLSQQNIQQTYNPSDNLTDLFSGLTAQDPFADQDSGAVPEHDSADEHSGAVVAEAEVLSASFPGNEEVSEETSAGLYEVLDDRLTVPVYDYFVDATDPPQIENLILVQEATQGATATGISAEDVTLEDVLVSNPFDSSTLKTERAGEVCAFAAPQEDVSALTEPNLSLSQEQFNFDSNEEAVFHGLDPPAIGFIDTILIIYASSSASNLTISLDEAGSLLLLDSLTGQDLACRSLLNTSEIVIYGLDYQNDTLTVDFSGGLINVPITFHGGEEGFDTLVVEGGHFSSTQFLASGPDSGSVLLDDVVIRYTGLEPITDNTDTATRVFTATASADQIRLKKASDVRQMTIESSNGTFESITFDNPTTSLIINAGDGDDTVIIESLDDLFAAKLIINGGDGKDTLVGPNGVNTWAVSGVNAGNLTSTMVSGTLNATFAQTENLIGGNKKDTFVFESLGFVTGDIDGAEGTTEISLAGFLNLAGEFSFSKQSRQVDLFHPTDGWTYDLDVETYEIGIIGGMAFVGLNDGPYMLDDNGTVGDFSDDTFSSSATGFRALVDEFAFALIKDSSDRTWLAAEGTLSSVEFVNIPDFTAAVSALSVALNTEAEDGTVIDFYDDPLDDTDAGQSLSINTGTGTVVLDFDATQGALIQASGTIELDAFGFVMAYGGFKLFKGEMDVNDGSYDAVNQTGIEPFKADLLSISFEQVSLFAGAGGKFIRDVDSDPNDGIDPPVNGFDHDVGAVGFYVDNATLWLTILQNADIPANRYLGLEFNLDGLGLEGINDLTLAISDGVLMVNWASDGDRLDWTTATINDETHDQYERLADFTDLTGEVQLQIAGSLALDVYGYVVAVGGFQLYKGQLTIDDDTNPATDGFEADVLTMSVEVAHLFAGMGASLVEDATGYAGYRLDTEGAVGFSVNVEDGSDDPSNFYLAIVQNTATSDRYVGVEFELVEASLVGIPGLTFEVGATVMVNWAEEGVDRLNWYQAAVNETDGRLPDFSEKLTSELDFLISGSMTLGVFDFLYASGSFALEKSSATVTVTDGETHETGVEVELLTVGATVSHAFAGVNGPYWEDADNDGVVDDDETSDAALGLELSNVELGLALMKATAEDDLRTWTALRAEVGDAGLVGIQGFELSVQSLAVEINRGGGTTSAGDPNPTVVDFLASWDNDENGIADPAVDGLELNTGDGTPLLLNYTTKILRAQGALTLVIDDYVFVNGAFAFEKGADRTVTLNDGNDTTPATQEVVSYLTVGASSVDIFVGNGPYHFTDSDGDGDFDEDDNPDAIGLVIGDASLALALLRSSMHTYYGVSASVSTADVLGFNVLEGILEFDISKVAVQVNGGNDGNRVVDFAASDLDGNGDNKTRVKTGPGADEYIDLDFSDKLLQVAATVILEIDDFVFIQGSVAFMFMPARSVKLSNRSTTDTDVSVLAVAATGVRAFVGIGPYDFTPDASTPDAVGLVVNNLDFGLVVMQDKTTPANKYFALKGSADNVALHGVPEITIGVEDIVLEINYSNHISALDGKRVVVDFTGDELSIDTGPKSSVVMNFSGELIRAQLANGVFELADFVFLSGNFAFEKGSRTIVDIATNFPGDFVRVSDALGDLLPEAIKNFGSNLTDLSRIENVEVTTLYLGASDVNGFFGLNGPYYVMDENGDPIVNTEAVGLSVENLDFGFVMMEPTLGALSAFAGLDGLLPKLYALKASSDRVAMVGLPDITLEANEVTVSVNFGNQWVAGVESFGRPVVDFAASFPAETTDSDGDGKLDPKGFELETGSKSIYIDFEGELLIGASVGQAVMHLSEFVHLSGSLAFELGPTYMVTVDAGIPAEIRNLIVEALEYFGVDETLQNLLDLIGIDLAAGTIEHEVVSFTVGGSNINAFVGMEGPYWTDLDEDGAISWVKVEQVNGEDVYKKLTEAEGDANENGIVDADETAELNENAVGLTVADLDFGMAVMQSNNPIFDLLRDVIGKVVNVIPGAGQIASVLATAIGEYIRPRYYALKGTAGQIGFVGLEDIVAEARNIVIEMNVATPAWGPFLPSLNFLKSFPDPDDDGPEPAGLKVDTGGDPVYLDFDSKLLRASVEQATLQLSEFLYLGGSFAFEAGPSYEVTVNSGIPPDLLDLIDNEVSGSTDLQDVLDLLGFDLETGTITHGVDSLSIGGSNVTAFAGINGPYWTDWDADGEVSWVRIEHENGEDTYTTLTEQEGDTNGNGIVDADETAELNENAIGLVATDLDFGIAVMQSNSPVFSLMSSVPPLAFVAELLRPRYVAVKGSAYNVGFVGVDDITAEIVNLAVEMNVATPWGPLLPSLDFAKSFPGEDLNGNNVLDTEDANDNGVLDSEDLNGNGILDPDEDANGNGVLDYGEDANQNGVLDTEDRDGDKKLDPVGFEVYTGSDSFYMDFDSGVIRAAVGQATLRVLDLVSFSGSFAFSAESKRTVTLTDAEGTQKDVAILTVAAQNVYGFVGVNGPYRVNDTDPVNEDAVGFAIDNFNLGMAIAVGLEILNPSLYFAMKASADTFGFVGIEGLETDSDGMNIDVNVGLSLDSTAAIDFSKFEGGGLSIGFGETKSSGSEDDTEPDDRGTVNRSEFQDDGVVTTLVNAGILETVDDNPDLFRFDDAISDEGQLRERLEQLENIGIDPILAIWRQTYEPRFLDFAKSVLKGHLAAKVSFLGVEFDGSFGFGEGDNDSTILAVLAHFKVHVGDLTLYESLASGILRIGDGGLAGKILLESQNLDPLAGLNIEGLSFSQDTRFDLLMNTTAKEVDILLPDYFDVFTAFKLENVDYLDETGKVVHYSDGDVLPEGGIELPDQMTTLVSTGDPTDPDYHLFIPKNQEVPAQPVPDAHPEIPGESYILLHADGTLAFPGILLQGTFDFKASGSEAMLIMNADFTVGAAGLNLLELQAAGIIRINSDGIAGKVKLRQVGDNLLEGLNIPGLNFDAETRFDLLINTTKQEADILLPEEFDVFDAFGLSDTVDYSNGVLLPDKISTLQSSPRGPPGEFDYHLILPKYAVLPGEPEPDPQPEGEFYILVHAEGHLNLPGAILEGSFNLFADESTVLMVMGGRLLVGFESLELLDLLAGGAFQIDSDGFAGKLQLSLDEDLDSIPFGELFKDIGEGLGFDLGVQFDLVVNTTTFDKDILLPDTFDPFTAFAVSAADQAILENVGVNDPPSWIWLSDQITKLQSQYDPVSEKVEYHLIVPKSPEIPPDPDQPGEFYILVHAVGKLAFPGFILDGGFDLFVYQQNAVMDIHAVMTVASFLELNAVGILQIDSTGIAGKIRLEIIDGKLPLSSLPGLGEAFGLDAEFNLIVNTTKQYKEIVFPERFSNLASFNLTPDETTELDTYGSVVLTDGLTRLKRLLNDHGDWEYSLIVNNTPNKEPLPPVDIPTPNDTGEFYFLVYANGDLRLPGAKLTGSFYLLNQETQTVMTVSGHLILGYGDLNLLDLVAGGAFYIDDTGLAGKLQLELDQSVPFEALFGPGFGFNSEAQFDLTINLTKEVQDFTLPESFDALDVFGVDPIDDQQIRDGVKLSDNLTILKLVWNPTKVKDEFHLIVPNTPNPGNSGEAYILAHAVGELSFPGFTLKGGFDLFMDKERATMDVHALMSMGFGDLKLMELEAIGVAQIDSTGLAGKIHLQLIDPNAPPSIPGIDTLEDTEAPFSSVFGDGSSGDLGFNAEALFDLIINTTKQYKDILLPDRFDNLQSFGITDEQEIALRGVNKNDSIASVALPDGLSRLKSVFIDADKTEFHLIINNTPDNAVPPPEEIPTPNDWGEMYMVVHAEGKLAFPGAALEGTFDLEVNEQFAVMVAYASLKVEFGTSPFIVTLLDLDAVGAIKINADGIAGKLKLSVASGAKVPFGDMGIDGFELDSSAAMDLLLNTTEKESEILLPDKFDPFESFHVPVGTDLSNGYVLDDQLTTLSSDASLTTFTLSIPNTSRGQKYVNHDQGQGEASASYILIHAQGKLKFPGFDMEGAFDLEIKDDFALMTVYADLEVGFGSLTLLDLDAVGVLQISAEGMAGKMKLSLASGADLPFEGLNIPGLRLNADASMDLLINTTRFQADILLPERLDPLEAFNIAQGTDLSGGYPLDDTLTTLTQDQNGYILTIPNTPGGQGTGTGVPYILVHVEGKLEFTGFYLDGSFDMVLDAYSAVMTGHANLHVGFGPGLTLLDMTAVGVMKIDENGVAGKFKLTQDGGMAPFEEISATLGLGVTMTSSFDLLINTTELESNIVLPKLFDPYTAFDINPDTDLTGGVVLEDQLTTLTSDAALTTFILTIPNTSRGQQYVNEEQTQGEAGAFYILIHAQGELAFPGMSLSGTFDLEAQTDSVLMTADAVLRIGFDVPLTDPVQRLTLLELNADGILKIDSSGYAGKLNLSASGGDATIGSEFGVSLNAEFYLIINTTGEEANILLPGRFDPIEAFDVTAGEEELAAGFPMDDGLTTLTGASGDYTLTVPNTPTGEAIVGLPYILVHANGFLEIFGFKLDGTFDLNVNASFVQMSADASMDLAIDSFTLMSFTAAGALKIDGRGVAGQLTLTSAETDLMTSVGVGLTGAFALQVNTSDQEVNVGTAENPIMIPAGPWVRIEVSGTGSDTPAEIWVASGAFRVTATRLLLEISGSGADTVVRGSAIGVAATIGADLNSFGSAYLVITKEGVGIAASAVGDDGDSTIPGIHFAGTLTLEINTTESPLVVGTRGDAVIVDPGFKFSGSLALQFVIDGQVLFEITGDIQLEIDSKIEIPSTSGGGEDAKATTSVKPRGPDNDLIIQATDSGDGFNGVTVVYEDTVKAGNEEVFYDSDNKILTIKYEEGKTTSNQIVQAFAEKVAADPAFRFTALLHQSQETANTGEGPVNLDARFSFTINGSINLGPLGSMAAKGLLVGNSKGVVANLQLGVGMGEQVTAATGFSLSGVFQLEINTTGSNDVTIDRFKIENGSVVIDNVTGEFVTEEVAIPARTVRVFAYGHLDFAGSFTITGRVLLTSGSQSFRIEADGTVALGPLGTIDVHGFLNVNSAGVVASLQLGGGTSRTVNGFGFSLAAVFQLEINTTSSPQTISRFGVNVQTGEVLGLQTVAIPARSVRVFAGGSLNLAGSFSIKGKFELMVTPDGLNIHFDSSLNMFGSYLTVYGSGGIFSGGIAINITLKSGQSTSSYLSFAGITMTGTFQLQVNTSSLERNDVPANTIKISVADLDIFLLGFSLKGGASIGYQSGIFKLDNLSLKLNFFNVLNIAVSGYISSDGKYDVLGSGVLNIGSTFLGLQGEVTVHLRKEPYRFYLGYSGSAYIFGYRLAYTSGQVRIENGTGYIDATVSVTITPAFDIWVTDPPYIIPWIGHWVHVPAWVVSYSHSFYLGRLGSPQPAPPAPGLATKFSDGTLRLNIGVDAGYRGSNDGITDEIFVVTYVSGDAGNETVAVTALGYTAQYSGVSRIVATDAGSGNDYIEIGAGVRAGVSLSGGEGNDQLICRGSGRATLSGGPGDDSLLGGSGSDKLEGGEGNDTLRGGPGNDELLGGPGNDSLYGEAGNDTLKGGAGDDTYGFEGDWGQDTIEELTDEGTDVLSFAGETRSLTAIMGSLSVIEGENRVTHAGSNIENLIGGSGSDALVGLNEPNTWAITENNAGSLNGGLTFSSIENLTGGSDSDQFVFSDGKGVSGIIDGQAGTNSLDYSAYSTAVTVDLGAGTATGTGAVVNIRNIIGGSAGDSLTGDAGPNEIIGNDGDDLIDGAAGPDSISGGSGVDEIFGGAGDDVISGNAGKDTIHAGSGSDIIYGDEDNDLIYGDQAGVTVHATEALVATLVGDHLVARSSGPMTLLTTVTSLDAETSAPGAVMITETDDIILSRVMTADGPIMVTAGGAVTASWVESLISSVLNPIELRTTAGSIAAGEINAGAGGDVTLNAADAIDDLAGKITADDLMATAGGSMVLDTTVNRLVASSNDEVTVTETDSITVNTSVASLMLTTKNPGDVVITESDHLTVIAINVEDGTLDLSGKDLTVTGSVAAKDLTVSAGGRVETIGSGVLISGSLTATALTGMNLTTAVDEITAQVIGTGDVVIREADSVVLEDVSTADGSIFIFAGGSITAIHVASQTDSNDNDVSLATSGGDIEVGSLFAGVQGGLTLMASGAIVDVGGMITADELTITAMGPITLVTTVRVLTGQSSGTVTVTETDDIELAGVQAAVGDVRVVSGGNIMVTGDITALDRVELLAAGVLSGISGALVTAFRLEASAGSGIELNTQVQEATLQISGTGDLRIAEVDAIALSDISMPNGAIEISAGGNLTVGRVESITDADENEIALISTSGTLEVNEVVAGVLGDVLLKSSAGLTARVAADELEVQAGGPVSLVTTVASLAVVTSDMGDVTVTETDGLVLSSILIANGAFSATAGGNITVNHLESLTDADGNDISLKSTSGDILIDLVRAGRSNGEIYLVAAGDIREVESWDVDVDVAGYHASISLQGEFGSSAYPELNLELDVSQFTFSGEDLVCAFSGDIVLSVVASGIVDVKATGTISVDYMISGGGEISLTADKDILIGYADAGAQNGVVTLTATGSIYELEPADDGVDLIAQEAYLYAGAHIGGGSEGNLYLETEVGALVAEVGSSTIYIHELDDMELVSVVAPDGEIGILVGEDILITGAVTTGTTSGIIFLQAGGRIYMEGDEPVTTNLLEAVANSGIFLRTQVATLDAKVGGQGILEIGETDSIVLRHVTNANGPIHVIAGGPMTAVCVVSLADAKGNNIGLMTLSGDILLDYVGAGSRNGQISLSSAGNISETADHDPDADLKGALRILYAQGKIDKGLDWGSKSSHHFGWKCTPSFTQYEFERGEKLNLTYLQGDVELFFSLKNKVHVFATGTINVTYLDSRGYDVYLRSKYEDIYVEYLNAGPCKGDVELAADGSVHLAGQLYSGDIGQIIAGDDLCISAGDDIRLLGNVSAGGDINLYAGDGLENAGPVIAGDDIWIKTGHGDAVINGALQAGDQFDVSAGKNLIMSAPLQAGSDLKLYAKGLLKTVDELATLSAGMDVILGTCRGDIELFGAITAGVRYTPCSSKHCCSSRQERPDVVINAGGALCAYETISSVGEVEIWANGGVSIERGITADDLIKIGTCGSLTITSDASLAAGKNMELYSKKAMTIDGILSAADEVTITSCGDILIFGSIKAWDDVTIFSWRDITLAGSIEAADRIELSARDDLVLSAGSAIAGLNGEMARFVRLWARDRMTLDGTIHAKKVISRC